ncbi:U3 small nucleolar RNA-associated protein 6 [Babesia ovis]|uniref:U3 small nucleolar RNA-associated protein 6 n=1 Tax=Babesia ovis TaxID=5869 RepID=A0A9W5T8D0_BABOV|nr:U3 small nucleolar RNA-associated protein 6 [Babesia ovis]
MAARVQQQLEDMVPELRKLTELQLFTDVEIRDIVERRRKYEFGVISTDPVYSRNSFREYINYEIELDRLLQKRLRQAKAQKSKGVVRYRMPSEQGKVPIKVIVRRRIHRIFNRCLKRFVTNVELWKEYCAFCYRIKAVGVMNRAIMGALSKNPTCEDLWKVAAKYTLDLRGSLAARNVIQLALRANPRNLSMFILLLELEVQSSYRIFEYSQSDEVDSKGIGPVELSTKTWVTILRHAIKTMNGADVFKMLFFAASICARVSRVPAFAQKLGDYETFASLVFQEMFNRRHIYPLMGLYVWQHRLLEAILMQRPDGPESSPSPNEVFTGMVEDCKETPGMIPVVSRFIQVVIRSGNDRIGVEMSEDDGPAWVTDIEGSAQDVGTEDATSKNIEPDVPGDAEIKLYCEGLESLKDICFLRSPSEDYDRLSQQCQCVKGMLTRRQLVALMSKYRNFFQKKLELSVAKAGAIISKSSVTTLVDALYNSEDDLLRFVAIQLGYSKGAPISVCGYSLCIEISGELSKDSTNPFVSLLKGNIVKAIGVTDLKPAIKVDMLLLLLNWEIIDARCKVEMVRRTSVNFNRGQLLAGVEAVVRSVSDDLQLVDLVLGLISSSTRIIIEDIAGGNTLVNSLFGIVEKRVPNLVDCLNKYRSNQSGLRNFDLLQVAMSLWQIGHTMAKIDAKVKSTGPSDSLDNGCDSGPVSTHSISGLIDLCEIAVSASESVNVEGTKLRVAFRSHCWNRYLQCAKWLEHLIISMPMLNLHEIECSSDTIASRAYAQLGSSFVTTLV